jgi:hypothetical protein
VWGVGGQVPSAASPFTVHRSPPTENGTLLAVHSRHRRTDLHQPVKIPVGEKPVKSP